MEQNMIDVKFRIAGSVILWTAGFILGARPAAAEEGLTWEACLKEAARHHPDVLAAGQAVRSAEAEFKSSRATYLPDVTGSATHSRVHSSSTNDNYSYGISGSQRIYPGLRTQPEVAQARANLDAALADFAGVQAAVRLDVKSAFAALQYAQEFVKLSEKIAERRERNVQLVKARFDAGREHKGSYLRSKAQAAEARYDLRQARRALRVAQRQLGRSIGRSEFAPLRIGSSYRPDAPPVSPDLDALSNLTPAVRRARAEDSAARAGLESARQEFKPTITASASATRSGGAWPPRSTSGDWTGKVAVDVPIFKGTREKHAVAAAQADAGQEAEEYKSVKEQTALDLEDLHAAFSDAVENISVQAAFLEAAEMRAEIAQAQYTGGLLSFEDWDIIEADLITQQKGSIASVRDGILAQGRWEEEIGKGLEE